MLYQVKRDDGVVLDAQFEIEGHELVLHSRGGTQGKDARNVDYTAALRLLLQRADEAGLSLVGVWVDSTQAKVLPPDQRRIWNKGDAPASSPAVVKLLSDRMKAIARSPGSKGGNSTKKLRIRLSTQLTSGALPKALGATAAIHGNPGSTKLPAEAFAKVTAEHVWDAVQKLAAGGVSHPYGQSTDYDLLVKSGKRLPPKAVFGLAASAALGYPVLPGHFTGGAETPCFRILQAAGFQIIPKNSPAKILDIPPSEDEQEEWNEGGKKLVVHYKSERAPGLSKAKKENFIKKHGRLFCERCGFEPVSRYGVSVSDACIEVHHRSVHLANMGKGHKTKLSDLRCLCANCHRVTHRELRVRAKAAASPAIS